MHLARTESVRAIEKALPPKKDQNGPTLRGLYSITLQNKAEILFLMIFERLTEYIKT